MHNSVPITQESQIIIDEVFRVLGLTIAFPDELQGHDRQAVSFRRSTREKLVVSFLEEMKVLLILEGFDELGKQQYREKAIGEVTNLAPQLEQSTMIITSRTGDFKYRIHNSSEYELCPLNKVQVTSFAHKWLGDPQIATDFLTKVYKTPFADTAMRPLTLAHLCAIYERISDIPEKPKTVYKKVINLLLEEWDQQRSIKRDSKYAHFEIDRKYEFLCHLAYALTEGLETTVFSTRDLIFVYRRIYEEYGLKAGEAQQVVSEIETHNGLMLQTGYDQFEFAHKSLQEFLTAEYVVKLPTIPFESETLIALPNELAIAVAISSSPTAYFTQLVLVNLTHARLTEDFVRTFLNRLLVEKPDFITNTSLDLALLTLCSYYIDLSLVRANRIRSLSSDLAFRELEKLVKSHRTNSRKGILDCYDTHRIYETADRNDIHGLILNEDKVPLYLDVHKSALPGILYMRSSILNPKGKGGR